MSAQMQAPAAPEVTSGAPRGGGSNIRLNPKQLAFFNRQLASMAKLNMPLAKGLRTMAKEVSDPQFRGLIESVQRDLEEGKTLQEALARYPESFGAIYIELLRAGETTGNLAVILEELTRYTETLARVRTRLRDAMLYPLVVACLTVVFVLIFFWFLIPNFVDIFVQAGLIKELHPAGDTTTVIGHEFDRNLGGPARFLFTMSFILSNPIVIFFGFVLGGGGLAYGIVKIRQGWETYDDYMFKIPIFGGLIRMATFLKITRTMRDLLVNGVSMVNALKLTARVAGNNRIQRKLEEIRSAVEEGRSFSKSLAGDDVFPETMVWKLQMGEEKGIVEEALGEVATEFELDIDTATQYLTSVLGPAMLLGMAFVIGCLMACLYPSLSALGKGPAGF
jgi:type II secretory pathway component PulF